MWMIETPFVNTTSVVNVIACIRETASVNLSVTKGSVSSEAAFVYLMNVINGTVWTSEAVFVNMVNVTNATVWMNGAVFVNIINSPSGTMWISETAVVNTINTTNALPLGSAPVGSAARFGAEPGPSI